MDPYALVQSYVDPVVLVLCIIMTEVIRRTLPTKDCVFWTRDVGPIINRLLPFIPLAVGAVIMYWMYHDKFPLHDNILKGFLNGGISAYLYRTYKVTILGE